jgi:hypothetical protein
MSAPRTLLLPLLVALALATGCEEKGVPAVAAPESAAPAKDPKGTELPKPSAAEEPKTEDKTAKVDEPKPEEEPGGATPESSAGAKVDPKAAKSAQPKEDEPEPTTGDKATEGSYSAWLQTSGKYKVGQAGAVVAVLNAQGEYHCNESYPYKFKLNSPPEGIAYAGDTARGASITPKSTTLRIPFTPSSAGSKTISGTFFFSVCNETTCQIKKQAMSVTINVEG